MQSVKFALVLVLMLAFVVNVAFTADQYQTGRLARPERSFDKSDMAKVAKAVPSSLRSSKIVLEKEKFLGRPMRAESMPVTAKPTTTGEIPKGIPLSGLHGTFTVGAGGALGDLNIMALVLNLVAVDGPVTFLLTDTAYTQGGIVLGATTGASALNTITIKPAAGNTSCVITLTDNVGGGGGLVFSGARYVTVEGTAVGEAAGSRNLTVRLSGTPTPATDAPIHIANSIGVTISDCIVPGNSTTQAWLSGNASVYLTADSGKYNSHVTVNNCELFGGHYGVKELGNYVKNYASYGVQDDHTSVTNCLIRDVGENGVNLQQVSYANVSGNTISRVVLGVSAGASPNLFYSGTGGPPGINVGINLANYPLIFRLSGIQIWGDNSTVYGNLVDSVYNNRTSAGTFGAGAYGIRLIGFGNNDPDPIFGGTFSFNGVPSTNVAVNNIITRVFSKAVQANLPTHEVGIEIESGRQDTLYHNTVYFSGAENPTNPGGISCIQIEGAQTTVNGYPLWVSVIQSAGSPSRTYVKNNILAVDRTGLAAGASEIVFITGPNIDYRAGSDNNVMYMGASGNIALTAAGIAYPSLFAFTGYNSTDTHSQADDPTLMSETNVAINLAGHSTADGTGANLNGRVPKDFAGITRGTPPDIGALEGTGAGAPHDTRGYALVSPGPAGAPAGLPFSPIAVTIINLGANAEVGVPVHVDIIDPTSAVTSFINTHDVAGLAAVNDTFSGSWTPSVGGDYIFKIYTVLPGDNYPANDTFTVHIPVAGQSTIPYASGFEDAASQLGWFGNGDWALGTSFTKLGGPHSGTKAYVTKPGAAGTVYTAQQNNLLFTPYFDFTSATGAVLSFYQSLNTEPGWDRSIMEYSVDTGRTWHQLGTLNDANGINWYSTAVYHNATIPLDCYDTATAISKSFPFGRYSGQGGQPPYAWSSNGECGHSGTETGPQGPDGYVYVQYDLGALPAGPLAVLGKSFVRFRYSAFSDGSATYDGWAIDDFRIDAAAPAQRSANITGTVYLDDNGNGTMDGSEVGIAGATVSLSYFGVHSRDTVADANGYYHFQISLPGHYSVSSNVAGYAITQPLQPLLYDMTYGGDGVDMTGKDIGRYQGSISGKVFNDVNGNGVLDAADTTGLRGYTIEVHRDSVTGTLVGSAVSDSVGNYTIAVPPYANYKVKEDSIATTRQTLPLGNNVPYTVSVSGNSGSPTSAVTGKNFGDIVFGKLVVYCNNDVNANGFKDNVDFGFGPTSTSGGIAVFDVYHGTSHISGPDTIGGGVLTDHFTVTNLDAGMYLVVMSYLSPGWLNTTPVIVAKSITASNQTATDTFLVATLFVKGTVLNDVNGNGIVDPADTIGLSGWTVSVRTLHNGTKTTTTDNLGKYQVSSILPPDSMYVSVTIPSGYVQTSTPAVVPLYSASSGTVLTANFTAFRQLNITGTVYRDRNVNGVRDAGEEGLVRTIQLSVSGTLSTTTSAGDGSYSFANVNQGLDTLREINIPAGWTISQPAGNSYTFAGGSGANLTGKNFGNYMPSDTGYRFRTFTPDEYFAAHGQKAVARVKPKKAILMPNLITALIELDKVTSKSPGIMAGIMGQPMPPPGTKFKAYVLQSSYGDFLKTFYGKGVAHTGMPRGLDFKNGNTSVLIDRQKSLGSDVQNNKLVADVLALSANVSLSDHGKTPAGLGDLLYVESGNSLSGKTLRQLLLGVDSIMTNWYGLAYSSYMNYDTVIAKINSAFSGPIDTIQWNKTADYNTSPLIIKGVRAVPQVAFLKFASNLVPRMVSKQAEWVPPASYALLQNYPNPFNPTTSIPFDLPEQSIVTVKIYNMLGQEIATLIDHQVMDADRQEVEFNASSLPSGVYFYRIMATSVTDGNSAAKTFMQVKKMLLLK